MERELDGGWAPLLIVTTCSVCVLEFARVNKVFACCGTSPSAGREEEGGGGERGEMSGADG